VPGARKTFTAGVGQREAHVTPGILGSDSRSETLLRQITAILDKDPKLMLTNLSIHVAEEGRKPYFEPPRSLEPKLREKHQ
jgi:hypothetical protein